MPKKQNAIDSKKIDDCQSPLIPSNSKQNIESQIETINKTLLNAETSFFNIGVPIIFPTKRVREIQKSINEPLFDYLRIELQTVPTIVLENYLDDLLMASISCGLSSIEDFRKEVVTSSFLKKLIGEYEQNDTRDSICLSINSKLEKYAMPIVLSIVAYLICYLFNFNKPSLVAITSFLISLTFCRDSYRLTSFAKNIRKEILRRYGSDNPNSSKLRLSLT